MTLRELRRVGRGHQYEPGHGTDKHQWLDRGLCRRRQLRDPRICAFAIRFTTFDIPAADPAPGGTFPQAINDFGATGGYYADANIIVHGFLRKAEGAITTFDAPGAGTAPDHPRY